MVDTDDTRNMPDDGQVSQKLSPNWIWLETITASTTSTAVLSTYIIHYSIQNQPTGLMLAVRHHSANVV